MRLNVKSEALQFYKLYGADAIDLLRKEIWRALAEKDDALALDLDGMLFEIEGFLHGDEAQRH